LSGTVLGIAAILLVAGTSAVWFRRMADVRIPENRTTFVAGWAGGVLLGVATFAQGTGWLGGIPAALAIALGGLFTALIAVSGQKAAGSVAIGTPLPDLTALDEHGAAFELSSLAGKPVLLKFFRGHW